MNSYLVAGIASIVLLGLGGYLIHKYGDSKEDKGVFKERSETSTEVVKEIKEYEKTYIELRKVDDAALAERYCHFVFDTSYSKCLSSVEFLD